MSAFSDVPAQNIRERISVSIPARIALANIMRGMKRSFGQTLDLLCARQAKYSKPGGGVNVTKLADAIGINQTALLRMLRGESREPRADNAKKLCAFFQVDREQLVGEKPIPSIDGKGKQAEFVDLQNHTLLGDVIAIAARAIPLSATIHGEHIHEGEDASKEPMYYQASWIKKMGFKPEQLVSRQVAGSSMEPALHDGDTVLINCASRQPIHGRTFWVTVEGEACVKRLLKLHGSWWISSDNHAHKVRDIQLEDPTQIMGEVVIKSSSHI